MNTPALTGAAWRRCSSSFQLVLWFALCLWLLGPTITVKAQVTTVTDDFNDGDDTGWSRLDRNPGTATFSFPGDGASGHHYQIFTRGPDTSLGIFIRTLSVRNDTIPYTDFFSAMDVVTWDDRVLGVAGPFITSRFAEAAFDGYILTFLNGGPRSSTTLFGIIEFQAEGVRNHVPDFYRGGAGLTAKFDPSKPYRMIFRSGISNTLVGAIFDPTDLLEPIVKLAARDDLRGSAHASGISGLGQLNTDWTAFCDWTYDNYHSTADPNTAPGFPGTAQVVELIPAAQTLFYPPPSTNRITFKLRTFTTNQINTNSVRLFLNGSDVSSQLVITDDGGLLDPPRTHYAVRYTGSLSNNAIYQGRIVVNDTSGKGTTNNWVFDTFDLPTTDPFSPEAPHLIEAEDYNYQNGQYQDFPPVSGTDDTGSGTDTGNGGHPGNPINAFPTGYYLAAGIEGVDYFDNTQETTGQGIDVVQRNQYRTADEVGTVQGIRGNIDTPRQDHIDAGVPDYFIFGINAGEWLNYTRSWIPKQNWYVYLRASAQARQDVRLDEITSDPTQPDQTNEIRGLFLVPNTGSSTRFRYVPLTDGAGNVQVLKSLDNSALTKTLRLTFLEANQINAIAVGDLQLNYLLFMPAGQVPSRPPWIAYASPSRDASDKVDPEQAVKIIILDRDTQVNSGSIRLYFDSSDVTSSATKEPEPTEGSGVRVTYQPPRMLLPNSTHTIKVVFGDGSIPLKTNEWSFRVRNLPLLPASYRESAPDTFFTVKVHKAQNANPTTPAANDFPNSIFRAEKQLAGQLNSADTMMPYPNEVANQPDGMTGLYIDAGPVNYQQCGLSTGLFAGNTNFPGLYPTNYPCPGDGPDHFAIAATIKLPLKAGVYRMGVHGDDQWQVTAGPQGTNVYLAGSLNSVVNRTDNDKGRTHFEFAVETNGVYNFRLVHEEGGGDAYVEWYFVNRTTGQRQLVTPLQLVSASEVAGPYLLETAAAFDTGSKTVTAPRSSDARFYQLRSASPSRITSVSLSANNIVLTYE